MNTDQSSQFTGEDYVNAVRSQGCKLSMDGRGAWRANVFIERFWPSIGYENLHLKAYDTVAHARHGVARLIDDYNTGWPHSGHSKTAEAGLCAIAASN